MTSPPSQLSVTLSSLRVQTCFRAWNHPSLGKHSKLPWLYPPSTPHFTHAAHLNHPLPKRVRLRGTCRNIMTVSMWKVYIVQVRLRTCRVHVRAVPVLLKICTRTSLLCVHPVSILLKIWWRCIYRFPESGVYIAQVRLHNRRVYVLAVPVFLKIWCHTPLALCTCCVCFPKNMFTMCQQFPRLRYVSPHGLGLLLLCCREATLSNYQIVHGLPPPPFSHPDFLECWCSRHETALSVSAHRNQTWGILGRYSVAEDA